MRILVINPNTSQPMTTQIADAAAVAAHPDTEVGVYAPGPGNYDLRGEIVDGWETRCHAGPAGDWVIVQLDAPGRLQAYPDGGIARIRALGTPTIQGLQHLRTQWEESA